MSRLLPEKLHVRLLAGAAVDGLHPTRRYTLTHSDRTGELFLTVGRDYDHDQIKGWYTRLMRDEVLAEWRAEERPPALHLYCHLSGGVVLGPAGWRYAIFRRELPLVLEAIRLGDARLFEAHPELDQASIWVHFRAAQQRYQRSEDWGTPAQYRRSATT
jgi:hypothetical protein